MGKVSENRFTFTKTSLLKLPVLDKQVYYWDTKVEGLGLGITPKGSRSFILYRRLNNRPTRIKLGRFPTMSVEKARKKAIHFHDEINEDNDPRRTQLAKLHASLTMLEVYKAYLEAKPNLSQGTIRLYEQNMRTSFSDWQNKPLKSITESMVQERHRRDSKITKTRANQSMRLLRALFNFARDNYRDAKHQSLYALNPVDILSRLKSWHTVHRRTTVIKQHQLKVVFWGMMTTQNNRMSPWTFRDFLLLCLFTGLRSGEVSSLHTHQIDLEERSILLKGETVKNKQDHFIPMSSFAFILIKNRINIIKHYHADNSKNLKEDVFKQGYLFPGVGTKGYFSEPRAACDPVVETTGIKFTPHDLRRTFITLAESLDISPYAWKLLVNHKIPKNDVSGGYVIPDIERLRTASQKICDIILLKAGCNNNGKELSRLLN